MSTEGGYFLPQPSHWPVVGCTGLFVTFVGAANWLHDEGNGPFIMFIGLGILAVMIIGWFGKVIRENQTGCYNLWVDRSFRSGMAWLIFSEAVFFGGFFGALFFTRLWSVPELGGVYHPMTHLMLWPDFEAQWPLLVNPDNHKYLGATSVTDTWSIPAINTALLLTSGITVTWAHWGLCKGKRRVLTIGLTLTILLGVSFLCLQGKEYYDAYNVHGLTLNAGVFGSLFFLLTGFHGLHVTLGATMLVVILGRSLAGHFTPNRHFAFEGAAWYWHFVDVVWLLLFVFVYWL